MKHSLSLGLALFGIWLLWSGQFEPWLVTLGFASCVFILYLSRRMRIVDEEGVPVHLGIRPFTQYAPWLIKEIAEANVDVSRRIIDPDLPIRPTVVCVKSSQGSELGRVIYANSITLTPGTVSIDMQGDRIWVHSLSYEGAAEDMAGEMDHRVSKLEGAS